MKKILLSAITLALGVGAAIGPASAAGGARQEVSGTVMGPAPWQDDSGCYAGLHRRVAIVGNESVNGDIGYHFDLDTKTWKKPFILEADEGNQMTPDFDIYFYAKFGTVEDIANDPVNAGAPYSVSFNTRAPGGEAGLVPENTEKVIVCMYAGAQGASAAGSFTYTAGKGVKLPKK